MSLVYALASLLLASPTPSPASNASASAASLAATPPPVIDKSPTPVVPAPADEAVVFRDLQARTGLDLERVWADYASERRDGQGFYEFTRARYRRRLGAGIGLSLAGLGLGAAGMAMVLIAAERDNEVDVVGGALVLTAGLGLAVPGAILWPVSQVRLHKLRRARAAALGRVQLRAAGPLALPRGLGLGLGLAF